MNSRILAERLKGQKDALAKLKALGLGDIPEARSLQRAISRREHEQAYRDCGLTKVRGALGGTYWE